MQAVALPVERVERAVEQVERVAVGPPAAERAAVAAWSGCRPEASASASASASAGRDSILSNLTAENDATTKVRLAPSV